MMGRIEQIFETFKSCWVYCMRCILKFSNIGSCAQFSHHPSEMLETAWEKHIQTFLHQRQIQFLSLYDTNLTIKPCPVVDIKKVGSRDNVPAPNKHSSYLVRTVVLYDKFNKLVVNYVINVYSFLYETNIQNRKYLYFKLLVQTTLTKQACI